MQYISLINATLGKIRQEPITDLSTDQTTDAYKAQLAVQRAVNRVYNHKTWAFRRRTLSLSLTSGTADYELSKSVGEIYGITLSEQPWVVKPASKSLFNLVPNPTDSGNPTHYILSDFVGVSEQPSSASVITAASSSASDTSQSLFIEGLVSGEWDYESINLAGTSSVSTSKSFSEIWSVSKSAATSGRISLTSNSGGVSVLTLAPSELTARFRKITFFPNPASDLTATVNHLILPPRLVHKLQDTLIPDRWDYVVEQWAFAFMLEPKGQEQQSEQQFQFEKAVKMLEDDMAGEEIVSVEEPLISLKAGQGSFSTGFGIPSGYGRVESA